MSIEKRWTQTISLFRKDIKIPRKEKLAAGFSEEIVMDTGFDPEQWYGYIPAWLRLEVVSSDTLRVLNTFPYEEFGMKSPETRVYERNDINTKMLPMRDRNQHHVVYRWKEDKHLRS